MPNPTIFYHGGGCSTGPSDEMAPMNVVVCAGEAFNRLYSLAASRVFQAKSLLPACYIRLPAAASSTFRQHSYYTPQTLSSLKWMYRLVTIFRQRD
ncbi:hypothetical protein GOP47_0011272 [Adiantum capillus-veneris]|uniref:Uncharacterized protein n=1 Tax=Adiantum capillus-veneris TaxID=13818 RepID=A0A9D4USW4_ADICA|nr:hypothetical protein GOP47_0011272 [Adiantum capillus-veneris]